MEVVLSQATRQCHERNILKCLAENDKYLERASPHRFDRPPVLLTFYDMDDRKCLQCLRLADLLPIRYDAACDTALSCGSASDGATRGSYPLGANLTMNCFLGPHCDE